MCLGYFRIYSRYLRGLQACQMQAGKRYWDVRTENNPV